MKPIAVILSDVHYNLQFLSLADAATRQAIAKANALKVPLVVTGDLHDSKANLRGECVNAMIETFKLCDLMPTVIVGNHCRINEKSTEHSLNFLEPYANIVNGQAYDPNLDVYMAAYSHDPNAIRRYLQTVPKGKIVLMHQGLKGGSFGEYVNDKSALDRQDVCNHRVLSGHYHERSFVPFTNGHHAFIGNPFTASFGESAHPEKGFQILHDDGSLTFVPTNLRKHVILNHKLGYAFAKTKKTVNPGDLVWVKLEGTKEQHNATGPKVVAGMLGLEEGSFKLDRIYTDKATKRRIQTMNQQPSEAFDALIDSMPEADSDTKERLKHTWKALADD